MGPEKIKGGTLKISWRLENNDAPCLGILVSYQGSDNYKLGH
jgi:hypothetical protein